MPSCQTSTTILVQVDGFLFVSSGFRLQTKVKYNIPSSRHPNQRLQTSVSYEKMQPRVAHAWGVVYQVRATEYPSARTESRDRESYEYARRLHKIPHPRQYSAARAAVTAPKMVASEKPRRELTEYPSLAFLVTYSWWSFRPCCKSA